MIEVNLLAKVEIKAHEGWRSLQNRLGLPERVGIKLIAKALPRMYALAFGRALASVSVLKPAHRLQAASILQVVSAEQSVTS